MGKVDDDAVKTSMTIGDFSRATRLSAKTLRFYHQAGLLEPARVDESNGYRFYDVEQISDAQVIREFRVLDMPLEVIRRVLAAPTVADRNAAISAHLARMEAQLEHTRSAVASLRGLLDPSPEPLEIGHRTIAPTPAVVIRGMIDVADLSSWYLAAMAELDAVMAGSSLAPAGPCGGLWDTELFLDERGEGALFFPVRSLDDAGELAGRARTELLPAVDLAVAIHRGTDDTIGRTYGELGAYVARLELGAEGPIRETYLHEPGADARDAITAITEIGWPIRPPVH